MGLDRLVMFLTDSCNIKEVLVRASPLRLPLLHRVRLPVLTHPGSLSLAPRQLFPAMRPEDPAAAASAATIPAGSAGAGGK